MYYIVYIMYYIVYIMYYIVYIMYYIVDIMYYIVDIMYYIVDIIYYIVDIVQEASMWTQKDIVTFKNTIKKESKMENHTDCIIKVGSGETVTVS